MKKVIIEFEIKDHFDELELKRALDANKLVNAIYEVGQKVFRPHRKYGYNKESRISQIIEYAESKKMTIKDEYEQETNIIIEAISVLEEMFYKQLDDEEVVDLLE